MKAINLQQVPQNFAPRTPLRGDQLRFWFMERAESPRAKLRARLFDAQRNHRSTKLLLIGHRGSGKTSEVNRLLTEVQEKYEALPVDVLELTGRTSIGYEDLMLVLATQITSYCITHGLIGRPASEPLREKWQQVSDWWQRLVMGLDFAPAGELSTYATLSTLLGEIEVGARQSAFTREQINAQVDRQMPHLVDNLNWVLAEAQKELNPRRLLLVVEGLDKVDLESARHIFHEHGQTITAPTATMIFTFPLALRYSDDYQTIKRYFDDDPFLPNLAIGQHADGVPNTEGIQALRSIVLRRLEPHLIVDNALDLLAQASGGIVVDLIRLVGDAAINALARHDTANQIELADAQEAIRDLRRDLIANLSRDEWQLLGQLHRSRELSNESAIQRLLYKGALIEYTNGLPWCDVHPLLWELLDRYAGG